MAGGDERIGLHSIKPPRGSRRPRKRVGRGEGSGTGKTAGRGEKGAGSRSGKKQRPRFEGGQNPIHMRMRKLRGPHMKKSMPFEPFRTHTQPVNLAALEERFDAGAEVTPDALKAKGLAKRKVGFEGGQNPIHMRMRKLRGPHMKKSMPFERFRTHTQPINLADLEARFDKGAEVTPDALRAKGLATRKDIPVKILAKGELSKALTVHAHGFSAAARERIEAAGGTCQLIEK